MRRLTLRPWFQSLPLLRFARGLLRPRLAGFSLLAGLAGFPWFPWFIGIPLVIDGFGARFKSRNHGLIHRAPQQFFNLGKQRFFFRRHQ